MGRGVKDARKGTKQRQFKVFCQFAVLSVLGGIILVPPRSVIRENFDEIQCIVAITRFKLHREALHASIDDLDWTGDSCTQQCR
jgi:hypothetical protein